MISIRQLSKGFSVQGKQIPILNIPYWDVAAGEKIAIIGPSGSGKSTLLHLLAGIISPDKGEIHVLSTPLHQLTEAKRDQYRARHIGYIFQDFHLIPSLTAKQNIELVLPGTLAMKEKNTLLHSWFQRVGLEDRMHHLPSQLSRGQQQRVAIIRALIHQPPLILADEPTGSLDWETAGELTDLLINNCLTENMTLIAVTHDLNLAGRFTKRVHISELNEAHSTGGHAAASSRKELAL